MKIYRVYSATKHLEKYFTSEQIAISFAIDCILQDLPDLIQYGSIEYVSEIVHLIKQSKYFEAIQKHLNFEPKYAFRYEEYIPDYYNNNTEEYLKIVEDRIKEEVFK